MFLNKNERKEKTVRDRRLSGSDHLRTGNPRKPDWRGPQPPLRSDRSRRRSVG